MFKWHADAIAVVALVTALGATLYAKNRSSVAATQRSQAARAAVAESSLLRVTRQTLHLATLSGREAPRELLAALDRDSSAAPARGWIVFVYTPGACERSIKDGLSTLGKMHERLQRAGLRALVVEGADSASSKEIALILRKELRYPAPLRFTPRSPLEAAVFDTADEQFAEEPSVLLLDAQRRVLAGVHTDQLRPDLFERWLSKVSDWTDE